MHIYGASVAIFVIGAFFAFVAPALNRLAISR